MDETKRKGGEILMERKRQMDSIEVMVGRIDERVKSIAEKVDEYRCENEEEHKNLIQGQKELCIHVNHEVELLTAKVNSIDNAGSSSFKEFTKMMVEFINEIKIVTKRNEKEISDLKLNEEKKKAEHEGQLKIWKTATTVLSIILSLVGLGKYFGVI